MLPWFNLEIMIDYALVAAPHFFSGSPSKKILDHTLSLWGLTAHGTDLMSQASPLLLLINLFFLWMVRKKCRWILKANWSVFPYRFVKSQRHYIPLNHVFTSSNPDSVLWNSNFWRGFLHKNFIFDFFMFFVSHIHIPASFSTFLHFTIL